MNLLTGMAPKQFTILAYGAGTDSTGIICGWIEKDRQRRRPIDAIMFADTGGEKPHTYEYLDIMDRFLAKHGMPKIIRVQKAGNNRTLEEDCLAKGMLPSLAYGYKGCSQKFKIEPQDKWVNNNPLARHIWSKGGKVAKLIGYEFREKHRWMKAKLDDEKYTYEFPLVRWEWNRPECQAAIERMGLPLPGKSACFFCPASTKPEIADLQARYPDLYARALQMEKTAAPNLQTVKGLGRKFAWSEYQLAKDERQPERCMSCIDYTDADDDFWEGL